MKDRGTEGRNHSLLRFVRIVLVLRFRSKNDVRARSRSKQIIQKGTFLCS